MNNSIFEKINSIDVDGELIYKNQIEKMNFEELHMLVSFVDSEKDLNKIKAWSQNERIIFYIDDLISNISRLENKWK
jgi:hypothetical protein